MMIMESASGIINVELTRRNLETLLAKLDDPDAVRTILSPCRTAMIVAVENEEHYSDRPAGPMIVNGEWI